MKKSITLSIAAVVALVSATVLSSCLSCTSCARKKAAREAAAMGYAPEMQQAPPPAESAAAPVAW